MQQLGCKLLLAPLARTEHGAPSTDTAAPTPARQNMTARLMCHVPAACAVAGAATVAVHLQLLQRGLQPRQQKLALYKSGCSCRTAVLYSHDSTNSSSPWLSAAASTGGQQATGLLLWLLLPQRAVQAPSLGIAGPSCAATAQTCNEQHVPGHQPIICAANLSGQHTANHINLKC
jgi:hypothetical protein